MIFTQNDRFLDMALLESALHLAGEKGWHNFSLVEAAHNAGLPIEQVRTAYPFKALLLIRLNRLADEAALCSENVGMTLREKLFDHFMRRFDIFQEYRNGLCAVLRYLPRDPALAALLGTATMDSLHWIADSTGLDRKGLGGMVRLNGLLLVWTHTLRTWEKDHSPDLANTMSTLDTALDHAERFRILKPLRPSPLSSPALTTPVTTAASAASSAASHKAEQKMELPDHIPTDTEE